MANIPFSDDRNAQPLFQTFYGSYLSFDPALGETWANDSAGPPSAGMTMNDGLSVDISVTNFRWVDLYFVYRTTSVSGLGLGGIDIALVSLTDPGIPAPSLGESLVHGPQMVKVISDRDGRITLDPTTKHYVMDGSGIGGLSGEYRFKLRVLATGEKLRVDTYIRTLGTGMTNADWNNPKLAASFIRIAK